MRLGLKCLLATGLIAAVIAVGFWLARVVVLTPATVTDSAPEVDTTSAPANTALAPAETDRPRAVAKTSPTRPQEALDGQAPGETAVTGSNLSTNWEQRVDDVLRLDLEPSAAGKKLMEMLPQMPAAGRVEALQHAANLLADEDYAPLGRMLSDPKTPEEEIELLMRDVLNRSNAIKLPLLLEVARTSGHLKAGEAREILEVFLGESYDDDWDKWQTKVNEFLKENPETAAPENR